MKTKKISVDDRQYVAPEVMFGELPAVLYEQRAADGVMHRHSEAQLSLVTEGSMLLRLPDDELLLSAGDAVYINCNRLHEALPADERGFVCLCLKFNPAAVGGGGDYGLQEKYVEPVVRTSAQNVLTFGPEACTEIKKLLAETEELTESGADCPEIRLNILLQRLWLLIFAAAGREEERTQSVSFSEKQRLDMLCDYIQKNYAEKITLDDIANAAHISKGECCRVFKRIFHTTPFRYLVYYRLNRSIALLMETDYSISEIAQHVGFCSSSYYTKCFRKEYNCVPHKYRQELHRPETAGIKE